MVNWQTAVLDFVSSSVLHFVSSIISSKIIADKFLRTIKNSHTLITNKFDKSLMTFYIFLKFVWRLLLVNMINAWYSSSKFFLRLLLLNLKLITKVVFEKTQKRLVYVTPWEIQNVCNMERFFQYNSTTQMVVKSNNCEE